MEKSEKLLSGWKARCLSTVGRLALLKSILLVRQVFMSVDQMLVNVKKRLEGWMGSLF